MQENNVISFIDTLASLALAAGANIECDFIAHKNGSDVDESHDYWVQSGFDVDSFMSREYA
jgi:hypothetical protein